MPHELLKLRISTPAGLFLSGRGFYQLEESSLYVQVGPIEPDSRFFSYLEADNVRLDLDRSGRLLFVEVNAGRHTWKVSDDLKLPASIGYADIHWLDFRRRISNPSLITDENRTILCIRFTDVPVKASYFLAENIIVQVTEDSCLASIIVTNIVDDLAGQEISAYRKEVRKHLDDKNSSDAAPSGNSL